MKVLVIRFSSIGDIVLTTPVMRGLKVEAGAEVHYLTFGRFAAVLAGNPYIDRIWKVEEDLGSILDELKKERFDWVIDLHHNLRTLRVKRSLGRPSKAFDKMNFRKWLLVRFGWNMMPEKHIVDRYMDAVRHLGVRDDGQGLDYFIGRGDREFAAASKRLWDDKPFLCLALGAAHATKQIPVDKIREFMARTESVIVLLGGPGEATLGESLEDGIQVFNFAGKSSLGQSAALIEACEMVVTPDTGMMHIAAALKKPIISVWGNTVPSLGMYPYYGAVGADELRSEVAGLSCRPCSKIGYNSCPKGHFKCMRQQNIASWVEFAGKHSGH